MLLIYLNYKPNSHSYYAYIYAIYKVSTSRITCM
jgi:hypothetical protein